MLELSNDEEQFAKQLKALGMELTKFPDGNFGLFSEYGGVAQGTLTELKGFLKEALEAMTPEDRKEVEAAIGNAGVDSVSGGG